jgi:uncharacterized membrane protein YkvA (DUF1232 family)
VLRVALGVAASLALTWVAFVAVLVVAAPRDVDLREAKRFVPDVVRLLRSLARDPSLGPAARRRLGLLLAYLALPIDLVPDVVPVLGYADDVIVIALVLRSLVRRGGADTLDRHWTGTPVGLRVVRRLAGVPEP